jgi:hypothetical protein
MEGTPILSIDWSSLNLKSIWKRFRQNCKFMFSILLVEKSEAVKCSYLLIWVGEKGWDIHSTWALTDAQTNRIKVYLDKFSEHVEPTTNLIFGRFIFHKRNQRDSETIEAYVTELKVLAIDCDFGDSKYIMIRYRLVFGVYSDDIREKLQSEGANLP